jgi:minor curlin subunit
MSAYYGNIDYSFDKSAISLLDKKKEEAPYIAFNLNKIIIFILGYQKIGYNIQIQQIGKSNTVKSFLRSNSVDLSVSQKGENNQLVLNKRSNAISQKVSQEGKNNYIEDFVLNAKYNVNMESTEYGDGQSIKNYGANSISKNMRVIQYRNGVSVIILNKIKS